LRSGVGGGGVQRRRAAGAENTECGSPDAPVWTDRRLAEVAIVFCSSECDVLVESRVTHLASSISLSVDAFPRLPPWSDVG
jgi:hypothetical protein